MVITKARSYDKVKLGLRKTDKIWLMSCNACVRFCKTGGEEKMRQMEKKLKKDGFKVLGSSLVGMACVLEQIKQVAKGDVIIMFSCQAGIFNLKKVIKGKKIISALETIGVGARDMKNNVALVKKFRDY